MYELPINPYRNIERGIGDPNLFTVKVHTLGVENNLFFNIENHDKIQVMGLVAKKKALATYSMRQLSLNLHPGP